MNTLIYFLNAGFVGSHEFKLWMCNLADEIKVCEINMEEPDIDD